MIYIISAVYFIFSNSRRVIIETTKSCKNKKSSCVSRFFYFFPRPDYLLNVFVAGAEPSVQDLNFQSC